MHIMRKSDKMNKTKEESKERKDIEVFYVVKHVKPYVQSEPIYFMDKETAQEYITTFTRQYYENYLLEASKVEIGKRGGGKAKITNILNNMMQEGLEITLEGGFLRKHNPYKNSAKLPLKHIGLKP